jgi:hypothetical protein
MAVRNSTFPTVTGPQFAEATPCEAWTRRCVTAHWLWPLGLALREAVGHIGRAGCGVIHQVLPRRVDP